MVERLSRLPKVRRSLHDALLLFRLAAEKAQKDGLGLIASALAFVSILSLVPLLAAFSFIGARAFRSYQEQVLDLLVQLLPYSEVALRQMLNELVLQAGRVQGLGLLFFLVGALTAFTTVERTINRTWTLPHRRPFRQRLFSFTLLLFWGPLLIGAAFSAAAVLRQRAGLSSMLNATGIIGLLPPAAILVGLTMLYWLVPYTRVGFRNALLGGTVATLLLELLRQGFSLYIRYFPGFNLVYGSVAFVFLFLVSMQLAWGIILAGNVLAYTAQHFPALAYMHRRGPRLAGPWLAMALLTLLARELDRGKPIVPLASLAARLRLSPAELRPVLGPLLRRRLLLATGREDEGYLLARPPRRIRIYEIFDCYDPRRLSRRELAPDELESDDLAPGGLVTGKPASKTPASGQAPSGDTEGPEVLLPPPGGLGLQGPGGGPDPTEETLPPPPEGLPQALEDVRRRVTSARAATLGDLTLADLALANQAHPPQESPTADSNQEPSSPTG
ncbi:MAG: YihY/virulence factor BrkB family protein [Acidobacteriota bacterium]|nr:YihY/virulence factor BrkB family protein [Acidobacteriota bacterium]